MMSQVVFVNGDVEMILRIPVDNYPHFCYLSNLWEHWLECFGFSRKQD